MKGIIHFVLKNKLAVWLLALILLGAGIYSTSRMNMETIPDITIPIITVTTVYPGATPEQVADEISVPMEKAVMNLRGVANVYSNSYANVSNVQIEFDYGLDMLDAEREIRSAIDGVELPESAQKPNYTRVTINAFPVVAFSISSMTEDLAELTETVEEVIVPKFEGIDGVSSVGISGQYLNEVELDFDEVKMAQLGITEDQVKQVIQSSDLKMPLGLFKFTEEEQSVVIDGRITTIDQLKQLIIPMTPTSTYPYSFVTLGYIANIELVGKAESISRTNGRNAISMQIVKGQEANTVEVVREAKDLAVELQNSIDGLIVDVTLDQGEPIEQSVEAMLSKAFIGALVAIIVILLFLRNIQSTIISVISIPFSLLMAFIILYYLDITLNIMTLGAMTVAIGRVIDDSIVVVENIYRRLHLKSEELRGRALIRSATIEMFKPILSSTLVTVAVFLPLIFVGGMVGELFMPFALTITLALLASLLVAITVVPTLSHTLFKRELYSEKRAIQHKNKKSSLAEGYKKALNWTLNHKFLTSVLAFGLLIASLFLIPKVGFSFLASEQQKMLYITYTPEPGEVESVTMKNVSEVEQKMMERDDVDVVQLSIGGTGNPMAGGGTNGALMYIIFDPETENFEKVSEDIEKYLQNLKHSGTWSKQNFNMSIGSSDLSYTVYGNNQADLEKAVAEIEKVMKQSEHLKDVSSSLSERYDEHTLKVNQRTLMLYGLSPAQLAYFLSPRSQDEVVTTIGNEGEEIDVVIRAEKNNASSFEQLLDTPISTSTGQTVRIRDIAEVEEGTVSNLISRSHGKLYASVSGTVTSKDVTKASNEVEEKLDAIELPKGVEIETSGVTADMLEAFTKLLFAMAGAIAIVYFILVVTFGEGLAPFSILFSLPFTVIGSLIALWLTNQTISVSVMMGMLMLIGIVVTNAIVLVDRIVRMEHDGMDRREAILEAGSTRLRPILMTAVATIGALIPLALGEEGSGLISKDLGVTVIGGLLSSTILTLFIVPIVYEVLSKLLRKNRKEIQED